MWKGDSGGDGCNRDIHTLGNAMSYRDICGCISSESKAFLSRWTFTGSVRHINHLDMASVSRWLTSVPWKHALHHCLRLFLLLLFEEPHTFSYTVARVIFIYNSVKSSLSFDSYFITSIFPVLLACSYKQKCVQVFFVVLFWSFVLLWGTIFWCAR